MNIKNIRNSGIEFIERCANRIEKNMRKAKDLTGQTFGRLIVLKQAGHSVEPSGQKNYYTCANVVVVT